MKIRVVYFENELFSLAKNHEDFFANFGFTLSSLLMNRLSFNSPNFNQIGTPTIKRIEAIIFVLNSN